MLIFEGMKRPLSVYLLVTCIGILSINALFGGGALVVKPDGSLLQLPLSWIADSIFTNYRIPGLLLLFNLGVLPLLSAIGLLFKTPMRLADKLNLYKDKHWSWAFSLYSGLITIGWIIVQQFLTSYFILQPLIALLGLIITILTLLPSVQRYAGK